MNSDGSALYRPHGIGSIEAFEFMLRKSEDRNPIHVCFASGYDVNMILKDVKRDALEELWDPENNTPAHWKSYALRYRKAKSFWIASGQRSITLWDVFGFFQSSFVKALHEFFPNVTGTDKEEIELITRMKKKRSTFQQEDYNEVRYYCSLELKWLVCLMDSLRERMRNVNLKTSRWDGAGAVATSLLQSVKIKRSMNQNFESCALALRAYYGGRIETTCLGSYCGTVYHYDLVSAYPSAMLELPTLAGGYWYEERLPKLTSRYSLHEVSWDIPDKTLPFYPLPYRNKNGSIVFPASGRGYYWGVELEQALRYITEHRGQVEIHRSYTYRVSNGNVGDSFRFVQEVFDNRQRLKQEKDGAQIVLKLGLNSLYGKFQQQLGGTRTKFPAFFQPEWSGYITAHCRAKMLAAAMQQTDSILMFATDGLFSLKPLELDLGKKLGQWESETHDGIIIVQPGVYYLYDIGAFTLKARGFDLDTLRNHTLVLRAWQKNKGKVAIETTRFVTLGSALTSETFWNAWRTWRTAPRELDLTGFSAKRHGVSDNRECYHRLLPTLAREARDYEYLGLPSHPFRTIWNQDEEQQEEIVDGVSLQVWQHETNREEYLG